MDGEFENKAVKAGEKGAFVAEGARAASSGKYANCAGKKARASVRVFIWLGALMLSGCAGRTPIHIPHLAEEAEQKRYVRFRGHSLELVENENLEVRPRGGDVVDVEGWYTKTELEREALRLGNEPVYCYLVFCYCEKDESLSVDIDPTVLVSTVNSKVRWPVGGNSSSVTGKISDGISVRVIRCSLPGSYFEGEKLPQQAGTETTYGGNLKVQYETTYISAGLQIDLGWDQFSIVDSAVAGQGASGPLISEHKVEVQRPAHSGWFFTGHRFMSQREARIIGLGGNDRLVYRMVGIAYDNDVQNYGTESRKAPATKVNLGETMFVAPKSEKQDDKGAAKSEQGKRGEVIPEPRAAPSKGNYPAPLRPAFRPPAQQGGPGANMKMSQPPP